MVVSRTITARVILAAIKKSRRIEGKGTSSTKILVMMAAGKIRLREFVVNDMERYCSAASAGLTN